LGTPTREEIKCMNPNYTEFKFPQIKAHPWHKVFGMEISLSHTYVFISIPHTNIICSSCLIRYSTSVCLQKLLIWFRDYYNIPPTYDAQP
jgi:hypothetical protein